MAIPIILALLITASIFVFSKPVRFVMKLALNVVFGFAALMIVNFLGEQFGIDLAVNWPNAAVTGILGIPGVALLIVLDYLAII